MCLSCVHSLSLSDGMGWKTHTHIHTHSMYKEQDCVVGFIWLYRDKQSITGAIRSTLLTINQLHQHRNEKVSTLVMSSDNIPLCLYFLKHTFVKSETWCIVSSVCFYMMPCFARVCMATQWPWWVKVGELFKDEGWHWLMGKQEEDEEDQGGKRKKTRRWRTEQNADGLITAERGLWVCVNDWQQTKRGPRRPNICLTSVLSLCLSGLPSF